MANDGKIEKIKRIGNLGNTKFRAGEYNEAIKCFEKCAKMATVISDKKAAKASYKGAGLVHEALGNFHKAIECYTKCLSIDLDSPDDRTGEEDVYVNIGRALVVVQKYYEAIEYLEKGLNITAEIGGEEEEYWQILGTAYRSMGKYDKAMEYHSKHLTFALEKGDKKQQENAYFGVGNVNHCLGKFHQAIEYYEKSLAIALELKHTDTEVSIYNNLGNSYQSMGKYHKAMEQHKRSLNLAIEQCDVYSQALAYSGIGANYMLMGKYDLALEYHQKTLDIGIQMANKECEQTSYGNMAIIFKALGRYEDAIKYHQKDLEISIQLGDKVGEGSAYCNLGDVYEGQRNYEKAVEYYKKSLDIAVSIGDTLGETTAYINLGSAYVSLRKQDKAIECHENSLKLARRIADRKGEGIAYVNLGISYQSLKKYNEAIEYHRKHIAITEEIGDKNGEGRGHFHFGLCYLKMHNMHKKSGSCSFMKEAETHLLKSIACFESLFDDLAQDQDKISIVDTYSSAYKLLASVYFELQQKDKALLVCERGRARALGELLNIIYGIDKKATKTSSILTTADVKQLLSRSNFCILFYALQPESPVVSIWVLTKEEPTFLVDSEIRALGSCQEEGAMETQEDSIDTEGKSTDTQEPDGNSLTDLVKNAYDDMKVREITNCEDRSIMFSHDGEEDNITEEAVHQQNKGETSQKPKSRNVYFRPDQDEKPLELLFEKLITPIMETLVHDEVVIIPDGPLFMVPFAALQDSLTGQFLSETKRIRLAPSLTTLKVLEETSKDHHYDSGALIVGNPKVGDVIFRGRERSITDLPGAEDEAERIGKLLGVKPLIGQEATKTLILQKLQVGVSVIHFAAHGSENGQILLAPSAPVPRNTAPEEKDYVLTMKETQEIGIRAQLVVLSCCHSGRGAIKSEGVVGMSRAFLAAGARAVLASLWAIDDEATKLFMLNFYSYLKKGKSASTSLQQAMKEMREIDKYKEPRYWAAFFLIGDDVTINL